MSVPGPKRRDRGQKRRDEVFRSFVSLLPLKPHSPYLGRSFLFSSPISLFPHFSSHFGQLLTSVFFILPLSQPCLPPPDLDEALSTFNNKRARIPPSLPPPPPPLFLPFPFLLFLPSLRSTKKLQLPLPLSTTTRIQRSSERQPSEEREDRRPPEEALSSSRLLKRQELLRLLRLLLPRLLPTKRSRIQDRPS